MLTLLWDLAVKVFLFIVAGMLMGRFSRGGGERFVGAFVWLILYVLAPLYALVSLWTSPVSLNGAWKAAGAAVLVVAGGAVLTWLWARARAVPFSRVSLPVVFMNSGYLAIPVNTVIWGMEGAYPTIIYGAVTGILNFTAGIWWVSGLNPVRSILELPFVYATVAGALLNYLSVDPPSVVQVHGDLVPAVTLPLMLVFVGYRLQKAPFEDLRNVIEGILLRVGGGLVTGMAALAVFGLGGAAAGAVLMASAMPAAIQSYILAERFREADERFAAASVFLGTLASLVYIPLLSWLLKSVFR